MEELDGSFEDVKEEEEEMIRDGTGPKQVQDLPLIPASNAPEGSSTGDEVQPSSPRAEQDPA